MKLTSKILIGLAVILVAGLLSSNIILKKKFNEIDKSDVYWTYKTILAHPFHHLKIMGGNGTKIFFQPSKTASVRLLREWVDYHNGEVKTDIKNDTLYLNFDYVPSSPFDKFWLQSTVAVRIFSDSLASVTGVNTNFEMQRTRQESIAVDISGLSKFEVETLLPNLDSVVVHQRDSSSVTFEISPDYTAPNKGATTSPRKVAVSNDGNIMITSVDPKPTFDETISIRSVNAVVRGHSILDIGHAQIENLNVAVDDSSAIVLSGHALKTRRRL